MKEKEDNIIAVKSFQFGVRCVKLYKYLCEESKDYCIGKQLLRSGTSIGANVKEAIRAQTRADFAAKMNISLKEASETEYWIELLQASGYITDKQAESLLADCVEILKLLTSIVKTSHSSKQ